MKSYKVKIVEEDIFDAVYNITANAAAQRGDDAHVATEDNKAILEEFLKKGKVLVAAALGRYGNGIEYPVVDGVEQPSVLKYSMPASWDFEDEVNERANKYLVDYIVASWIGLAAEIELPALELITILNKRKKPI